jgi:hypothetical protein
MLILDAAMKITLSDSALHLFPPIKAKLNTEIPPSLWHYTESETALPKLVLAVICLQQRQAETTVFLLSFSFLYFLNCFLEVKLFFISGPVLRDKNIPVVV